MKKKLVKVTLTFLIAVIFIGALATCGDPSDIGGSTLTINLTGNARAATGFSGAVNSADLGWTITLTNNQTRETRNAAINSDGTSASITGLPIGDWDINADVTIFGWPYAKGGVKSFPVKAGHNDASITMERLPNAVVLKGITTGEEISFPSTEINTAAPEGYLIEIYNFTDQSDITVTVNLPANDGLSISAASLTIPQDDKITLTITPNAGTAGVFRPALSVSVPGIISATVPLSYIVYPENGGIITLAEELDAIRGNLSGHYILDDDIDLSDYPNWEPIGNSANRFTGTFDGGGFTISNLTINRPDANGQGLFGYISSGAVIKNTGLIGVNITGGEQIGGIVGDITDSSCLVANCYVNDGLISGTYMVGGIVGRNSASTISNCYNTSDVECTRTSGYGYAGGIVGYVPSSSSVNVDNCYNTGNVNSSMGYVGGIAGYIYSGNMGANCISLGLSVTAGAGQVGRVVGNNGGFFNNYARADMIVNTTTVSGSDNNRNGEDITVAEYYDAGWWTTPAPSGPGWSAANWDFANGRLPRLKQTTGAAFAGTQNPTVP